MSEAKSGDFDRSRGGDPKKDMDETPSKAKRKSRKASGDLGRALKSVYDTTLAESVPTDFLDLLGKLD